MRVVAIHMFPLGARSLCRALALDALDFSAIESQRRRVVDRFRKSRFVNRSIRASYPQSTFYQMEADNR